LLMALA